MKATFLSLLFVTFSVCAFNQTGPSNSIIGTLKDSASSRSLEYGTVSLFVSGTDKALTGTTTDKAGAFVLTDILPGNYRIVFECLGFTTFTMTNFSIVKKDAIINLKNVMLVARHNTLQGVTVTATARLIENKIDKMVFNAEKDLTSQGGVATDVLKKVPQVSVDVDGNVQLAGNSGIRFLINGKPSSAFGSNIADVLQSIPASQIKSIEVITNPGAKYDAQGLGGIINLILKNNTSKGYNGNISLTAGTRNENGNFNFNVRNNNFGFNAFVSGNKRLRVKAGNDSYRQTFINDTVSTLIQSSQSNFEREGYQAGVGFDWGVDTFNNFSGNMSYNHFGNNGYGNTLQTLRQDQFGTLPDLLTAISSTNRFTAHNIDASVNYKRTFKKEDEALEISADISNGNHKIYAFGNQSLLPQDSLYYGTNSYNPATIKETEFTIDYTLPFKHDVKFGTGGKINIYDINSSSDVSSYQPLGGIYKPDAGLSNGLNYKQKVYAVYAELTFPVATLFDVKIGSRYERTNINSYYSNAQQQVQVPGYNTVVPSLYLSRKLGEQQTLRLSYSQRIERPDYEDLNPFVNTSDPKNLTAGNPYLVPETGKRLELSYNREFGKTGSASINLFYRINNNDIQPYIVYYPSFLVGDSLYTNVSVNTRQNIGRENNMGMNLFADLHLTAKLSIRGNVFLFYRRTINKIDPGYNINSFNYRFNINATYQFTNSLVAEFFGNFNAARNEAQGKYPSFISYTTAIRKQIWKKKGSIALTTNNLFSEYIYQRTILSGTNFTSTNDRKIPFRSIGLNFTWKFGKLEFKKKNDDNDPGNNSAP